MSSHFSGCFCLLPCHCHPVPLVLCLPTSSHDYMSSVSVDSITLLLFSSSTKVTASICFYFLLRYSFSDTLLYQLLWNPVKLSLRRDMSLFSFLVVVCYETCGGVLTKLIFKYISIVDLCRSQPDFVMTFSSVCMLLCVFFSCMKMYDLPQSCFHEVGNVKHVFDQKK